jgi:hypothetical protein
MGLDPQRHSKSTMLTLLCLGFGYFVAHGVFSQGIVSAKDIFCGFSVAEGLSVRLPNSDIVKTLRVREADIEAQSRALITSWHDLPFQEGATLVTGSVSQCRS